VKRVSLLLALGVAAVVLQGAAATVLSPPWCPDLALLVLVGIALRWRGLARGLMLAALLGYTRDLLSGSLLGQHALLYLFAFTGTVVATRRLNLRGAWPLAAFVTVLSVLYGLAMLVLTGFFVGGAELQISWLGAQLLHAGTTGAFAPALSGLVGWLSDWADDDPGRRSFGLDGIGRPA
jgi:rod shape-determining protein MreD